MITIRLANVDDLPTIERLAREIWPVTYGEILSPEQLAYMLDLIYNNAVLRDQLLNQHHTFLIAELEGKPVAFAVFSTIEPGICKLHKIYVHQNTQGKGVGKQLIDHITEHLRSQSMHTLRLNVNRQNKARFFYEKLGFKVVKEEDIDIGNGYFMIDFVMEKKLVSGN
ncbi:GNAT family N-acetyltransferase [Niastella caeni]|uniref:GNAT family N-acetyltransferase n=1 Tax=Niastella caeni TaxID=2569763 RepID=A0A4S8HZ54_9BACT|nr:GNAT family N-acetyltransferase [Niastella caeni]THU39454.1 GNAT family N-acetyltransferase [Niastella caeni]